MGLNEVWQKLIKAEPAEGWRSVLEEILAQDEIRDDEELREWGLVRVPVSPKLRGYEDLCQWRDSRGEWSAGYVFEIFQKL